MWFLRRRRNESIENGDAADAALKDAEENLERIKERQEAVDEVAHSLASVRKHNHFAEAMENIVLRKREAQ